MLETVEKWLNCPIVDEETKKEIRALAGNEEELMSRFGTSLSFGTGGLRAMLGAGTNRMNIYVVRHATQGVADLIASCGKEAMERGVVVGCDCRNYSKEFVREICRVLVANGIRVYCFDELRPTPEVSYAVRKLHAMAAVNVTASHNTKEYNGYKVYWEDGAQIGLEQADAVIASREKRDMFEGVLVASEEETAAKTTVLGKEFDEGYLDCVLHCRINPKVIEEQSDMAVIYTPFHGAGYRLAPEVLRRAGFRKVIGVPEQMVVDGNFPTVKSPNPEYKEGFALAIRLAEAQGADFIVGTDPDADRCGIVVRRPDGEFEALTGNQTGALLLDYILSARKATGNLPANACAIKTVVTSEMAAQVAASYGVEMQNVLTGFKFIGEKIKGFEATGSHTYVFGFEESYGYLTDTYARDKDGVAATLLVAEMAAYYRGKGMSLWEALQGLYARFGFYKEQTVSVVMTGFDAPEQQKAYMKKLRDNPPKTLGGLAVTEVLDFANGVADLPKTNLLRFALADGSVFLVRPSGTEPKVKIYYMVSGASAEESEQKLNALKTAVAEFTEK